MGQFISTFYNKFFSKKLEICLLGLESCGKTTFVNQLMGESKPTFPTIGLNVKNVQKGNVSMKVWDIGGQFQFRQNWVDYANLADVIIFMVDSSDYIKIPIAKKELYNLLEEKTLQNKPILILANKVDIEPHMNQVEIISELNLDYLNTNPWAVINLSALKGNNFEKAVEWLSQKGK